MENHTPHCGRLIDHIQLMVNIVDASNAFESAVVAELEIPAVITDNDSIWAYERVISSVKSSRPVGKPTRQHHLAFQATDHVSVDAFYQAALHHGRRDNGTPAERTCPIGYDAAFVLDPAVTTLKLYSTEREIAAHAL